MLKICAIFRLMTIITQRFSTSQPHEIRSFPTFLKENSAQIILLEESEVLLSNLLLTGRQLHFLSHIDEHNKAVAYLTMLGSHTCLVVPSSQGLKPHTPLRPDPLPTPAVIRL